VLCGLVMVESEASRRALINSIRINEGEEPIDWLGYDQREAPAE
jgi:hypothetical protein